MSTEKSKRDNIQSIRRIRGQLRKDGFFSLLKAVFVFIIGLSAFTYIFAAPLLLFFIIFFFELVIPLLILLAIVLYLVASLSAYLIAPKATFADYETYVHHVTVTSIFFMLVLGVILHGIVRGRAF